MVILLIAFLLTGCATKAVFVQGGENSSARIEASMTGGSIDIKGPFIYCEERVAKDSPATPSVESCPVLAPKEVK